MRTRFEADDLPGPGMEGIAGVLGQLALVDERSGAVPLGSDDTVTGTLARHMTLESVGQRGDAAPTILGGREHQVETRALGPRRYERCG